MVDVSQARTGVTHRSAGGSAIPAEASSCRGSFAIEPARPALVSAFVLVGEHRGGRLDIADDDGGGALGRGFVGGSPSASGIGQRVP